MKCSDTYLSQNGSVTNSVSISGDYSKTVTPEYQRGEMNIDLCRYPRFAEMVNSGPSGYAQLLAAWAIFIYRFSQQRHRSIDVLMEKPVVGNEELVATFNCDKVSDQMAEWIARAHVIFAPAGKTTNKSDEVRVSSHFSGDNGRTGSSEERVADVVPSGSRIAFQIPQYPREAIDLKFDSKSEIGYDLNLRITAEEVGGEPSTGAVVACIYNSLLFKAATISRIIDGVHTVLDAVIQDSSSLITEIELLSDSAYQNIVETLVGPSFEMPSSTALDWFQDQARQQPESVAAMFGSDSIRYRELEVRSNQLAHYIREQGVGLQSPIAVCVNPSIDILVAILGIMKAGCIYVPLDPSFPTARLVTILEDVSAKLVIAHKDVREILPGEGFSFLLIDSQKHELDRRSTDVVDRMPGLDDIAYIFYTSGTTGKPKGVVATHRNLCHYLLSAKKVYHIVSTDSFCSLARYTFSISLFELMLPLVCGARIRLLVREQILDPVQLTRTLQEVSVVHAGASLLRNLFRHLSQDIDSGRVLPNIRHASSGGDLVPPDTIEQMKQVFPNAEIYVIYGCTEIACMGSTYFASRDNKVKASLVGKPFPNVSVRLLDKQQKVVPFGMEGEICFSGLGLFREYLGRPELNQEKNMMIDGHRYYKTGDLGRLDADGNIEILGRRDFQVQLRGIRVELGEIETAIRELRLATECLVTVKYLEDHEPRLVAFVVNCSQVDIAKFRHELSKRLPDYMLPQNLIVLDQLPLTPNGKLDRKRLHEMPLQPVVMEGYVAPTTDIELEIAQVFAESLKVKRVGIDDIFFDLGGDSLLAVTVMYQLQNKFGLQFSPGLLFECPTVRMIAQRLENSEDLEPKPILLGQESAAPSVFMLAGVNLYQHLARHLDGDYSVYGAFVAQELSMFQIADSKASVFDLGREYVNLICRQQPHGPYRLIGMSFGGIIAFEVAQQLQALGEKIEFLGMIDAVMPRQGIWAKVDALSRLRHLPINEALSVLYRSLGTRLSRKLKGLQSPDFLRQRDNSELVSLEERRQGVYTQAAGDYLNCARPFLGNVALVVSGQRLASDPMADPQCGWSRLLPEVESTTLDADHLGLVEEPSVQQIAELFRKKMQA